MKSNAFVHLFKTPLNYYMYDVNKNAIVRIDESVYDYLQNAEGPEPEQMAKLRQEGYLSEKRPKKIEHPMTGRLENELNNNMFHIILQVTKQCNFRCAYCIYGEVAFDLQRHHENDFMTYDTAKKAVDFLAQHSRDQKTVAIGFYGGEPLLAYPLIQKIILYSQNVFKDKNVIFSMTTNGSLLTPEMARFLFAHKCRVIISFDGPPEVQNTSRRFASNGHGSYDFVYQNIQHIIDEVPDAISNLSINTVIDPRNKYQDIINYFENDSVLNKLPSKRVLEDDTFSLENSVPTDDYVIKNEMQKFFAILSRYHLYPNSQASKLTVLDLKDQLGKFIQKMGGFSELPDIMAPGGPCIPGQRRSLITTEGDIFPCERVSENTEAFKIGNIDSGFDLEKAKKILNIGQLTEEDCKNCWALIHCSLCVRYCDNAGELSGAKKRVYCSNVRKTTEQTMKLYVLLHEMEEKYTIK